MRKQVGFEAEQGERNQPCRGSKHLPSCREDQQGGEQREDHRKDPHAKDQRPRGILATVCGPVAEEELSPVQVTFRLEEPVLKRWHLEVERQQRQRRNLLHQRRMLRVQPEVVGLPALVPGEDVVALVPRERLSADRMDHLPHQHHEQQEDGDGHPTPFISDRLHSQAHISPRCTLARLTHPSFYVSAAIACSRSAIRVEGSSRPT